MSKDDDENDICEDCGAEDPDRCNWCHACLECHSRCGSICGDCDDYERIVNDA